MLKTYSRVVSVLADTSKEASTDCLGGCRLCFSKNNGFICVYSPDIENTPAYKIKYCTGLQVTDGDGLPNRICINCYQLLNNFSNFKKMCLSNDAKLKSALEERSSALLKDLKPDDSLEAGTPRGVVEECHDVPESEEDNCLLADDICWLPDTPTDLIASSCREQQAGQPSSLLLQEETNKVNNVNTVPEKDNHPNNKKTENFVRFTKPETTNSKPRAKEVKTFTVVICEYCGLKTKSYRDLLTHEADQHNIPVHYCTICSKVFKNTTKRDEHFKKHTNRKKSFTCVICLKNFELKSNLKRHFVIHNTQSIKCEICQKNVT